jgi:hypothetical protein
MPGPSVAFQASASTPTGESASWFWSYDCYRCNRPAFAGDIGFSYGVRRADGARPLELGLGITGIRPYVDGYLQLDGGRTPYGVGFRVAPSGTWSQYQLYGRYDILLRDNRKLLLNPSAFLITGDSPNGANDASFLAFVQGIGMLFEGERTSLTPAIAIVAGWSDREPDGGSGAAVFGTASLAVTFHRRRSTTR